MNLKMSKKKIIIYAIGPGPRMWNTLLLLTSLIVHVVHNISFFLMDEIENSAHLA